VLGSDSFAIATKRLLLPPTKQEVGRFIIYFVGVATALTLTCAASCASQRLLLTG